VTTSLLHQRSGKFYDAWESLDEGARLRAVRSRLDEYIEYSVKNVPFYRGRLAAYGRDGRHPLAGVPCMTAAELRELLPPKSDELVVGKGKVYNVFQSGGTTGVPKTTLFSHEELEGLNLPNARGFYAVGLESGDRVANLWAVGGLYMTFLHINRMLQQYGCMNFPFSNHTPVDFVHTMVRLFDINCVSGISSVVLNALRGMRKLGSDGMTVDKVYYGGEHLYETDKAEIRAAFRTRIIAAPGYGTVDTWYIGYQCLECPTGVFHCHDDQCYAEIVDEQTGRHCGPGETGLMYATPFTRRLTPIVRYRVGDRAHWLGKPCPCGRGTPLFKLLGRGDDVLRIGFDSVDYAFVQSAAQKVGGLLGSIQMEKRRRDGRDELIVRAETEAPASERRDLAARLSDELTASRPTLREAAASGTIWPIRVELFDAGAIPTNSRTGKLVRVIDAAHD